MFNLLICTVVFIFTFAMVLLGIESPVKYISFEYGVCISLGYITSELRIMKFLTKLKP